MHIQLRDRYSCRSICSLCHSQWSTTAIQSTCSLL